MQILIVDDETAVAGILVRMIDRMGSSAEAVGSAEEGLAFLSQFTPDAIILDVGLPGMSGFRALTEFKARTQAPVLLLSGHADEELRADALRLGAFDLMAKPMEFNHFESMLKLLAERSAESRASTCARNGGAS